MPIYNAIIPAVDSEETRRYAGLSRAENFPEDKIAAACQTAQMLIEPRCVWEEYPYDCQKNMVGDTFALTGKSIAKHLQGCVGAIILAATVGEEIEGEIERLFKTGNYAAAVILDAAATAAAEQTADAAEKVIRKEKAAAGLAMKPRFSPGYGDFPLTEQPAFITMSHAEKIGISLSENLMLMPRKSITAIIGLTPASPHPRRKTCQNCPRVNCMARRL